MTRRDPREPSWALAAIAITLAILTIYFSSKIRSPANVRDGDPGPKAFPIGLGVVVLIGGLVESARAATFRRQRALPKPSDIAANDKQEEGNGAHALLGLLAVIAYAWLIPRLGFPLTSFLFATFAMTCLGMRWFWSAVCALLLVVLIQVLFAVVFRVQLPSGRYLDALRNLATHRPAVPAPVMDGQGQSRHDPPQVNS